MRVPLLLLLFLCTTLTFVSAKKKCKPKAWAATSLNDIDANVFNPTDGRTIRRSTQSVYLWPSLTEKERNLLRDAFFQIGRRTCITFEELEYKPWYHAERWDQDKPYVLVRKSKKYAAYSDNTVEGIVGRTILYISENAFEQDTHNNSRGAIMDQLVRFMGLMLLLTSNQSQLCPHNHLQSSIQHNLSGHSILKASRSHYGPETGLFTASLISYCRYRLTEYCPARNDQDIGGGQRVGLLTKFDTIKLNSMYCPERVPKTANPREGPCVVPRKGHIDDFRRKVFAYQAKKNSLRQA